MCIHPSRPSPGSRLSLTSKTPVGPPSGPNPPGVDDGGPQPGSQQSRAGPAREPAYVRAVTDGGPAARMNAVAERTLWWRAGGVSALAGAFLWGVKSASILLTGYQPPVIFEAGPALFAFAVASLASRHPAGLARAALALGGSACLAGVAAFGSELTGETWDAALAAAMVGVILGLILVGLAIRGESGTVGAAGSVALALGLGTLPALAVGGMLSQVDERLLELPVLALACLWAWLGRLMLRLRDR